MLAGVFAGRGPEIEEAEEILPPMPAPQSSVRYQNQLSMPRQPNQMYNNVRTPSQPTRGEGRRSQPAAAGRSEGYRGYDPPARQSERYYDDRRYQDSNPARPSGPRNEDREPRSW
jgi:hypothetical protein